MAAGGVVLVGGGGHALVVADAAAGIGLNVLGCLDDAPDAVVSQAGSGGFGGLPVPRLGPLAMFDLSSLTPSGGPGTTPSRSSVGLPATARFILALGALEARRALIEHAGGTPDRFVTICHATACVSSSAIVSEGVFVGPRAVINARASIGPHAIVNSGAIIEHECRVGPNVHVAPGAVLGGRVHIEADSLIGIGARVIPGVRIGSGAIVGAGAVVIRDVPDGAKIVGCPARRL